MPGRTFQSFSRRTRRLAGTGLALAVLCCVLCQPPSPALAQQRGLLLTPSMQEVQLEPGAEKRSIFYLTNGTDEVFSMRVRAMDFLSRPGQGYHYAEPGHSSYSPSAWIRLSPDSFELQPGQTMEVEARISVPEAVETGERYAAVFFETVPTVTGDDISVGISARLISILYLTVPGPGFEPEVVAGIQTVTMPGIAQGSPLDFKLTLHNSGNVHARLAAKVDFNGLWGRHVTELDLGEVTVLPGSERTLTGSLDNVPFMDRLSARFVIGYYDENGELVNRSHTVRLWVLPWKTLLPGLLIISGTIVLLVAFKKRYNLRLEHKTPSSSGRPIRPGATFRRGPNNGPPDRRLFR